MGDHDARYPIDSTASGLDPWVARAQRGDHRAFEWVARQVYPRVFRWALVQTRSPDDADEVAQRVLIRMHARLHTLSGGGAFLPWLYRITRNATVDLFRSRSSGERRRREIPADLVDERADAERLLDRIDDERLVNLVHAFFEALPARQRQVFDLVDLQGLTPAEAAEALGMNDSTLRANLLKARRAIRTRILESVPALARDRDHEV